MQRLSDPLEPVPRRLYQPAQPVPQVVADVGEPIPEIGEEAGQDPDDVPDGVPDRVDDARHDVSEVAGHPGYVRENVPAHDGLQARRQPPIEGEPLYLAPGDSAVDGLAPELTIALPGEIEVRGCRVEWVAFRR